jgi:ankyrin repeat protein
VRLYNYCQIVPGWRTINPSANDNLLVVFYFQGKTKLSFMYIMSAMNCAGWGWWGVQYLEHVADLSLMYGGTVSFVTASGTTWITASGTTWVTAVEFISSSDLNSAPSNLSTVITQLQVWLRMTAVHRAVQNGDEKKVLALLKYGPDLSIRDKTGQTAVQWAVRLNHWSIAMILLAVNSDHSLLVPLDRQFEIPLLYAAEANDVKTVKILLETGANPNFQLRPRQDTPLHAAVRQNRADMVEMLLKAGAHVDPKSYHTGVTPLHCAVESNNEDLANILLEAGSDVFAKDVYRKTAFAIGIKNKRPMSTALLKTFLAAKVNVNEDGLLPLHREIYHESLHPESDIHFKLLVDTGADVTAPDENGYCPIHFAVEGYHATMVQILIAAGANVSARARHGWTPLHHISASPLSGDKRSAYRSCHDINYPYRPRSRLPHFPNREPCCRRTSLGTG